MEDLAFDELARIYEQVADLRITESVRQNAITGDIRSQTLYYHRVRNLVAGMEPVDEPMVSRESIFAPAQAEAMIRAALAAHDESAKAEPSASCAPRSPVSSRPASPGSPRSRKPTTPDDEAEPEDG